MTESAQECPARYHLNKAVTCYLDGEHATHEGVYFLAGRRVTWTDADHELKERHPFAPAQPTKTAMEEAFERARRTDG